MDPLKIAFGFMVGLLVGVTGVGGGSIMTPLLILVLGVKPITAVGTDLAYAALTKTLGGWRHFRRGSVDMKLSGWLAVGSIPGALAGVYVLRVLHRVYGDHFDTLVLWIVAGALLVTAVATLGRAVLVDASAREVDRAQLGTGLKVAAVVTGLVVGFVLGVSSAGSGALIAVALIVVFRLKPLAVVGTGVAHAAMLLWVAGLAHLLSGNVNLLLTANLLLGSLPGVWLGSGAALKLRPETLRRGLGVVLFTAAAGLLLKAGVGISAPLFVAIPLVLTAVSWLGPRLRTRLRARSPEPETAAELAGSGV